MTNWLMPQSNPLNRPPVRHPPLRIGLRLDRIVRFPHPLSFRRDHRSLHLPHAIGICLSIQDRGGGGGGAIDPITGTLGLILAGCGFAARRRRKDEEFAKRVEKKRAQLERYESLCNEIGHPPGEVAIAWLLHNPVVTAPIIGPRTVEQLESAVRATAIELDQETLNKLDEIFPGPGEAPKAYSW